VALGRIGTNLNSGDRYPDSRMVLHLGDLHEAGSDRKERGKMKRRDERVTGQLDAVCRSADRGAAG
jgi:hypothetical protein